MRIRSSLAVLLALAAFAVACDSPTGSREQILANLELVSGDAQQAVVGTALPNALVVRVTDDKGKPIQGLVVNFRVTSGGGTVFAGSAATNKDGLAQERWTLGTVAADSQRLEARAVDAETGQALVFATFRATALPDVPQAVAAVGTGVRAGDAGAALADSLAAKVTDRYGNGVPGATVVWNVTRGGGTVSPAQSTTDAQGVAKTQWTLGVRLDSVQTAEASISPAVRAEFSATAGLPLGAQLTKVSGDAQNATAGDPLAQPLVVRLALADGRPVVGATITWAIATGGGSVTPPTSVTDADGKAQTSWRLGTGSGQQGVSASVESLTEWFTANAAAGAPTTFAKVGGDGQTAGAGSAAADLLAVRVTDAHGNPVPGVPVSWTVLSGGGSVSAATATTDANGVARTQWTLGLRVDSIQSVRAQVSAALQLQFNAMATVPSGAHLVPVSGNGQAAPVGTQLPVPVVVRLRLPDGRGIIGAPVTLAAAPNSGSITPTSAVTDAGGQVSATWTLGNQAGTATVTVGSPGVASLPLTATAAAGAPANMVLVTGDGQAGHAGVPLPTLLGVRVTDAFGNRVQGVAVNWSASKLSAFAPLLSTTDAQGIAQTQWTPQQGGAQTATATLAATGQTVNFSATMLWRPSSVTVMPATATLLVGDSIVLEASALGQSGQPLPDPPFTWTASPSYAISITQQGVVRGLSYSSSAATVYGIAQLETRLDSAVLTLRVPRIDALLTGGACGLDGVNHVLCFSSTSSTTSLALGGARVAGEDAVSGGCAINQAGQYVCVSNGTATVQPNPLGLAELYGPCALDGDGDAYCSGTNLAGELGDGTVNSNRFPAPGYPYTAVTGGHKFTSMAWGTNHRCALTGGGQAYCWGYDQMGQLGSSAVTRRCQTGPTNDGECSPVPLLVEGGHTFTQVTAGSQHTCGLKADGTVFCWGLNYWGQLGTGSTTGPDLCTSAEGQPPITPCAQAPVQATGLAFTKIEAFGHTTCGIVADGRLFCWGYNENGQLGTGDKVSRSVPTLVAGGLLFKDVAGGLGFSQGQPSTYTNLGLTTDGRVFRWGNGVTVPTQIAGQI